MNSVFAIFHLNLAYSSISSGQRRDVIDRCYSPLLDLAEKTGIPVGIELSGWTLEEIGRLAPEWVARFRGLLHRGVCDLVGSGYVQLIGPLVPFEVNQWNQRLGLRVYEEILSTTPRLALVNELAYSASLVSLYRDAGYSGLILDGDNVRLATGNTGARIPLPSAVLGTGDATLPVIWSDSILFQKLQRFLHGDIGRSDYMDYLRERVSQETVPLALYCNDAEVIDYRPGRYREEACLHPDGEWSRLHSLFMTLEPEIGVVWQRPSEFLQSDAGSGREASTVTSAAWPVPVKKQAKYNLARWAVSGRHDLWINTLCHRLYRSLAKHPSQQTETNWRRLCQLWSSDLRTHCEDRRWKQAMEDAEEFAAQLGVATRFASEPDSRHGQQTVSNDAASLEIDDEGLYLSVRTPGVDLVCNLRRGLSLHRLAFSSQGFEPVIGTLPHGYFDSIALGADYYSAGLVVELPAQRRRVTDLEWVKPRWWYEAGDLVIEAMIDTPLGTLIKRIRLPQVEESVEIELAFPGWDRPHGTVRVNAVTLLPAACIEPVCLRCHNGGETAEEFLVEGLIDQAAPVSSLVSCTTGYGATTGEIIIGHSRHAIKLDWDPAECAAFPMLVHKPATPTALTRLILTLGELDETFRPGGQLPTLRYRISPTALNPV